VFHRLKRYVVKSKKHRMNKIKLITMCDCVLDGNGSCSHSTSYGGDRSDDISSRTCHYHESTAKSMSPTVQVCSFYLFHQFYIFDVWYHICVVARLIYLSIYFCDRQLDGPPLIWPEGNWRLCKPLRCLQTVKLWDHAPSINRKTSIGQVLVKISDREHTVVWRLLPEKQMI